MPAEVDLGGKVKMLYPVSRRFLSSMKYYQIPTKQTLSDTL
jgi:hypothetical protein